MDDDSDCHEVEMLCQIDNFLKNVAKNLQDNGVTEIPAQVDMRKFEQLLSRILSLLDKDDLMDRFGGIYPVILAQAAQEWGNLKTPENKAFKQLSFEFENLLVDHQQFSPADIVGPFIIADKELKREAIQRLTRSRAFQLKPLNKSGKFHEFKTQIMDYMESSGKDYSAERQMLVIPLDSVVKQARIIPELSSEDIVDATVAIDKSNEALLEFVEMGEIILVNQIFRSLIGDLLGVILDLPGKLLGSGGGGSRKGGSGITITIGLGGEDDYDDDEEEEVSKPKKNPSKATTTARNIASTKSVGSKTNPTGTFE